MVILLFESFRKSHACRIHPIKATATQAPPAVPSKNMDICLFMMLSKCSTKCFWQNFYLIGFYVESGTSGKTRVGINGMFFSLSYRFFFLYLDNLDWCYLLVLLIWQSLCANLLVCCVWNSRFIFEELFSWRWEYNGLVYLISIYIYIYIYIILFI